MTNTRRNPKQTSLKIVGLILSESYQRCKILAQRLHRHHRTRFQSPEITGMLDVDWTEYLNKLRRNLGGQTWAVKQSVVVFLNGSFFGSEPEMMERFKQYEHKQPTAEVLREHARREYLTRLGQNELYVFLELSVDGDHMGSLLFQLRHDLLPESCQWFAELCHSAGPTGHTYKGTTVHRICRRGWFQAGMIEQPMKKFLEDEHYAYMHDRRGILSFARSEKHMNQSQFFVTFEPAPWMDTKYVAFGRLVEGDDVLTRIENTPATYEVPDRVITIENCGIADVGLGASIIPGLSRKGITVGEPHMDPSFLIDLLFERFNQALFERLDEEVKKELEGEWVKEMFWEKVIRELIRRCPPVEDVLDEKDKSSLYYLAERYLAGLYGPPDIPDHYIDCLLENLMARVLHRGEIKDMAASVVNMLVNAALDDATEAEGAAEDIIKYLLEGVLRDVYVTSSCPFSLVPSRVVLLRPGKASFADTHSCSSEFVQSTRLEGDQLTVPSAGSGLDQTMKVSVEEYMVELLADLLRKVSTGSETSLHRPSAVEEE